MRATTITSWFFDAQIIKILIKPRLIFTLVTVAMITDLASASDYPAASRESIEWCDIWISHANETNLPRVLLIGDSISRDYYARVEKLLSGKAYVGRLSSSAFIADPVLIQQVK